MRKWWKKHYCPFCKHHVIFPSLHIVVHVLDIIKESADYDSSGSDS